MIRKYHNHKLQTNSNSNDSSLSPASPWRYQMLAKPAMRRCIPPQHGKINCINIGLARLISEAFINKTISKYADAYLIDQYLPITKALNRVTTPPQ